ncbi:hypothetical protein LTR10_017356 [Elasticomyces elasticus]|uniref:SnoaL-like domain-containing protein n=1 Tax=Exophiala sideris TaxID=1016849 RepID=A0ABR0J8Y3_9EURO|nr:hypothetical protein LTR10_017356 [Elasticomyces elasticus]KAK5027886.1 hypothetical protein LTS07_006762 [Exophiala sideris]KAK5037524.1 hypothetical protein LTR13_004681 [Exophiala sideris]KAK5059185.1 hypothetical protein LTR69_006474 [Exophiala sideris]KAK5183019.1 hypothetical protein LTR44_004729 [Eurotiomycetes sp. CCFEE 6388]
MAQALSSATLPPTPISSEVKDLINRIFHLVDQRDDNVGTILAEQIFTPDAMFISANGTFQGKEEISASRANAWKVVTSRHHMVDKVFSGNADGTDLVLVGRLETRTKDSDATKSTEFAARGVVDKAAVGGPRFSSYQAWVGNSSTI